MDAPTRKMLGDLIRSTRASVEAAADENPAPVYSQRWVDRRRLLVSEELLQLIEGLLEAEAVDARALAEQMQAVLRRTHDIAPGFGLVEASEVILHALADAPPA